MKLKFYAVLGLLVLSSVSFSISEANSRKTGEQRPMTIEDFNGCAPCYARYQETLGNGKSKVGDMTGRDSASSGKSTAESSEINSETK